MNLIENKKEVARCMRRLYKKNLTTLSGGNVSLRTDDHFLITPSQKDKALLRAKDICVLSSGGENLTPGMCVSMEADMHRAVYSNRPDVNAIVHAHPTHATAFAVMGREINTRLTGETWAILGQPATAAYALMGSKELAGNVAEKAKSSNVILLEHHGALTMGKTLTEAYDRMEVLEAAAAMTLMLELMNTRRELSGQQLKEIDRLFE